MQVERIGRYSVREVIGRGAAGIVYLAHDPLIEREVALKTLRVDLDEDAAREFSFRFLGEARAAGRLVHPNIVTVFDVGEDPEQEFLFIAMEHLSGRNLKQLLADGTRFEVEQAADLAATLADALDYAHASGVVHRDVKPANVILTDVGSPKLTDFGVARRDSSMLTTAGTLVGTPLYMSPEQVAGGRADGRSDLYALGVLLFELLTGERPFRADSLPELSLKIVHEPPPEVASLRPEVGDALAAVVMRCLAKDPARRYQSGADLAQAIRAASGVRRPLAESQGTSVHSGHAPTAAAAEPGDEQDPFVLTQPSATVAQTPGLRGLLSRVSAPMWAVPAALAAIVIVAVSAALVHQRDSPRLDDVEAMARMVEVANERLQLADERLAAGDLDGAIDAANMVLADHPSSQAATDIVTEARRRQEAGRESARVGIHFACPVTRGVMVITLDGSELENVPWDFSRKLVLGITRGGRGEVTGSVQIPPGDHELGIRLTSSKNGPLGAHTFAQSFAPGSRWQLTVTMAKKKAEPIFALEPVS